VVWRCNRMFSEFRQKKPQPILLGISIAKNKFQLVLFSQGKLDFLGNLRCSWISPQPVREIRFSFGGIQGGKIILFVFFFKLDFLLRKIFFWGISYLFWSPNWKQIANIIFFPNFFSVGCLWSSWQTKQICVLPSKRNTNS